MAKARKRVKGTGVKKQWFPILATKLFNEQIIGETYLIDITKAIGRIVPVNMMNLTRDIKRQNISIIFKINNATANKLYTELIGYQMQASSLKRMVRRGKNKVDYSFKTETADGYKIQLKVIIVTLKLTNLSSLTSLRRVCKESLTNTISKMKYDIFVAELVNHKIQSNLKHQLKKIFPLRSCEVRYMRVIKKPKATIKKIKKEVEEKKE